MLSKNYLYGVFGDRATHRWEPSPIIPVSGHAPDVFTMDAAIAMVEEFDPNLVFVNLGDVDRMGHSDFTGPDLQARRRLALADTDLQVGRFIDLLKTAAAGSTRWSSCSPTTRWTGRCRTDHQPDPPFEAVPRSPARSQIADNGGADLLYWTGPPPRRPPPIEDARGGAGHEGVLSVRRAVAAARSDAGDLVVYCQAGWRFSDPEYVDNPIPGNHGHPATEPIPFFIGGGPPSCPGVLVLAAGADHGRRAHGRRGVRARRPARRVRRPQPALSA